MRYAFGGIVLLVLLVLLTAGLGFAAQGTDFFMFKVFAPKYEQVRYDTFKQSQAFNDGMVQQLEKERLEYLRAKATDERDAIGSVVLHQFAGYDTSRLSFDEKAFLDRVQLDQAGGAR